MQARVFEVDLLPAKVHQKIPRSFFLMAHVMGDIFIPRATDLRTAEAIADCLAPRWIGASSHTPAAHEPQFDQVRERCVTQQHGSDERRIEPRQWSKTKRAAREK